MIKLLKTAIFAGVIWFCLAAWLPFPHEKLQVPSRNTRFMDREDRLLRRQLADGDEDQDWVGLSESGEWAGPALISVEDQRFYRHPGVDPVAVMRAIGQNLRHGRVVSGASTLSTQVIRLIEPRPRTLSTKVIEAFRATQLEIHYDKEFILEQYLNRAPFGGNRIGIATASRRYYGKEPGGLSSGEAALLMGLPQSPSRFRPDRYPEKAEARRETVLRRMMEEGIIRERPLVEEGVRWEAPPLKAFHFTEWVRRRYGWKSGTLHTTLDGAIQEDGERVLERWKADPRYAETDGVGMVLMDARTGEIRAWISGWDAQDPMQGQVDTVTRKRAPGSTLKPFVYAQAMQEGWLTPTTRMSDLPMQYRDYHPENMNEKWSGDVSVHSALVQSLNLPALTITEKVGVSTLLGVLRSSGMELKGVMAEDVGLGAVLGGGMEGSLLELVQSYSVFAGGGTGVQASGLVGENVKRSPVFSEGVAYWVSRMLSGPERDEILYGHAGDVSRPDLAFKTGTSHGLRDAWAIGWNEDWVLGVWVGRMDGAPVQGLSGSSHAAPLLGELALHIFEPGRGSWPEKPDSVVEWKGREVLAGVTDPEDDSATRTIRKRILRPAPNLHLQLLEGEEFQLPLQASGEEPVLWFVNGEFRVRVSGSQVVHLPFQVGTHQLRAVFADGTADTRSLRIEKL